MRVPPRPNQKSPDEQRAEARARRTVSPEQFGFTVAPEDEAPRGLDFDTREHRKFSPDTPLRTAQGAMAPEDVDKYVAQPKAPSYNNPLGLPPLLVEHGDSLWVQDGHHRIAAARKRGEHFNADVIRSFDPDEQR